jgi:hypothetical protein
VRGEEIKSALDLPQLAGRKAHAADTGGEPACRSGRSDSRPRCAIGLFDLGMKEMVPAGAERGKRRAISRSFGEKMSRRGPGVSRRTGGWSAYWEGRAILCSGLGRDGLMCITGKAGGRACWGVSRGCGRGKAGGRCCVASAKGGCKPICVYLRIFWPDGDVENTNFPLLFSGFAGIFVGFCTIVSTK